MERLASQLEPRHAWVGAARSFPLPAIEFPDVHADGRPDANPTTSQHEIEVRTSIAQEPLQDTLASSAMHRLCQPLTALQCILELGMDGEDAAAMRSSMADSLRECVRAIAMMSIFRDLIELGTRYAIKSPPLDARRIAIENGFEWREGEGSSAGKRHLQLAGRSTPTRTSEQDGIAATSDGAPALIEASAEGLDFVFRHVNRAFASAGIGSTEHLQEEVQASVLSLATRHAREVRFEWTLTRPGGESWLRECAMAQPFEVSDLDFTHNEIPCLAGAIAVAESMGARLAFGSFGVELALPLARVPAAARSEHKRPERASASEHTDRKAHRN